MAQVGEAIAKHATSLHSFIGKIPVRNIWLLMLYASEVKIVWDKRDVKTEDLADELPELVAELLSRSVKRRLHRQLTMGYHTRRAILNRVRGHIDFLTTKSHSLLEQGQVACHFEELTMDTPANRFVRLALEKIFSLLRASNAKSETEEQRKHLAHSCLSLAKNFEAMGVIGTAPTRSEMNHLYSTIGRNRYSAEDKNMVAAAMLAYDMAMVTEEAGSTRLSQPYKEEVWVRKLFENAVKGFYRVALSKENWTVNKTRTLHWHRDEPKDTDGISEILPSMQADIILDLRDEPGKRIIIDTKFTKILQAGYYREHSLRSSYIYQIYAYVRSQHGKGDELADTASGVLLHPAVGENIDEQTTIQGHCFRFMTIDLSAETSEIRKQLLSVTETGNPQRL